MLGLVMQVGLLAAAGPGWEQHLESLELGRPPPLALSRASERISASAPRGLAQGLLETGLLAALNRAGAGLRWGEASPERAGAQVFLRGRGARASWVVAVDAQGAARAALFRVPVPVDPSAGPPGGFGPGRLRRRDRALAALAGWGLRPLAAEGRGGLAWSGRRGKMRAEVRYIPERDLLKIVVIPR